MRKDKKSKKEIWSKAVTRNYGFFHAIIQSVVLAKGFSALTKWNCCGSLCLMTEKGQCDIYFSKDAINRFYRVAKSEYGKGQYDHHFYQQLEKFCNSAFLYSKKIFQRDFSKLSSPELCKTYKKFLDCYSILYNVMIFSHYTAGAFTKDFKELIQEKDREGGINKYLATLITLDCPSVAILENITRLKLLQFIYREPKLLYLPSTKRKPLTKSEVRNYLVLGLLKEKASLKVVRRLFPEFIKKIDDYLINFAGLHMEYLNKPWKYKDVFNYLERLAQENTPKRVKQILQENSLEQQSIKKSKKEMVR